MQHTLGKLCALHTALWYTQQLAQQNDPTAREGMACKDQQETLGQFYKLHAESLRSTFRSNPSMMQQSTSKLWPCSCTTSCAFSTCAQEGSPVLVHARVLTRGLQQYLNKGRDHPQCTTRLCQLHPNCRLATGGKPTHNNCRDDWANQPANDTCTATTPPCLASANWQLPTAINKLGHGTAPGALIIP